MADRSQWTSGLISLTHRPISSTGFCKITQLCALHGFFVRMVYWCCRSWTWVVLIVWYVDLACRRVYEGTGRKEERTFFEVESGLGEEEDRRPWSIGCLSGEPPRFQALWSLGLRWSSNLSIETLRRVGLLQRGTPSDERWRGMMWSDWWVATYRSEERKH